MDEDLTLVEAFKRGEESAFTALVIKAETIRMLEEVRRIVEQGGRRQ